MEQNNIESKLLQLVEAVTSLSTQVAQMQASLSRIEGMTPNIALHEEKISQLQNSLSLGQKHFEKIDERLDNLERAPGRKAMGVWSQIGSYILVAVLAAIVGNLGVIIQALGK